MPNSIMVWAAGSRFKTDPTVVGEIFEALSEENAGLVTARAVVDVARPTESPIHDEFEWNDEVAGQSWREETARGYMPLARVLSSDDLWGQVVADIVRDLRNYRYKLAAFKQFTPHVENAFKELEGFLIAAKE